MQASTHDSARIGGFIPKPRTIDVECEWLDPIEGAEPLRATIVANLTFAQIDHVAGLLRASTTTYLELFEVVAPQVVAWNARQFDQASGEYAPVPPPADIGHDALRVVDPIVTTWLAWELSRSHLGGAERQGKSRPSGDTPEPGGDASMISPPREETKTTKTNRTRPKGSAAF